MKCETALTEGRGQAFSLHLPLTVPLFMRLTFACWKGPESQEERKTLPAAGPEQHWEECRAMPGWAGSGWDAQPSRPPHPLFPGVTPSPLGSSPAAFPCRHRCFLPGVLSLAPCLGSPGHPDPACSTGGLAAPPALLAAAARPQGHVW